MDAAHAQSHARADALLKKPFRAIGYAASLLAFTGGFAARTEAEPADVVVTATRIPEPAHEVPAFISVVSGNELGTRGAPQMAGAPSPVPRARAPAAGG